MEIQIFFFFLGKHSQFLNADNLLKLFFFFFPKNTVWAKENIWADWTWPMGHPPAASAQRVPAPSEAGPSPAAIANHQSGLEITPLLMPLPSP